MTFFRITGWATWGLICSTLPAIAQVTTGATPSQAPIVTTVIPEPAAPGAGVGNASGIGTAPATADDGPAVTITPQGISMDVAGTDVVAALRSLAAKADASIVFLSSATGTANATIKNVTLDRAVAMLTQSAGLGFRKDGSDYVVGSATDLANLAPVDPANTILRIYRSKHISANSLVTSLTAAFDPQRLKVVAGPSYSSPDLEATSTTDSSGVSQSFQPLITQQGDDQLRTLDVVLSGDAESVEKALQLCEQLDRHRAQVRLKINISDVSLDASRELGIQYDFSNPITVTEGSRTNAAGENINRPSLSFGRLERSPISFTATLAALERKNRAKILAQPTLSLLDGERSFILIGQRLIFPVLVSTSITYGPQYSTQEVRVGIYIQVAAQITDDDVVLSIYPQVSSILDYIEVAGTRYPQISTREQQTTIRAKNNETFVISGLIREEEVRGFERVPILGKLPILGELFKFRSSSKGRSELLVSITPEIIRDADDKAAATPLTALPAPESPQPITPSIPLVVPAPVP